MTTFWTIPRCFDGATVAILGSGPSLTQEQVDCLRGRCSVVALNRTHVLAPWAAWLWAPDSSRFWRWCGGPDRLYQDEPDALQHSGEKVVLLSPTTLPEPRACVPALAAAGVRVVRNAGVTGYHGLSDDPAVVRGTNAGHSAINGVMLAGAARIVLLGFDMRPGHFHAPWPKPTPEVPYTAAAWQLDALVPMLAQRGVEAVNCTPGSALRKWPRATLENTL